jgi:branched-chain amino acid transport system substrate-binding protein
MVYEANISLTQIDFTAECRNAQQAGVELMFVAADSNTLLRWARSCARQQFFPQYFGGGITVNEDVIQQRGLESIIVPSPVFPFQAASGGAIDQYNEAMARYRGGAPGPADSFGWAAAKEFELIATRAAAASRSIASATLLAAAHTLDHETLGGLTAPLTFTGDTPSTPNCYFVVRGNGGRWTLPNGSGMQCFD